MNFRLPMSARFVVTLVLGLAALSLTGCGINNAIAPTEPIEDQGGGVLGGSLYGGQNPISGGTVELWVAGYTGYGSGPVSNTHLASATTNAAGGFSFPTSGGISTYTCPTPSTATPQLVYLTASGGDSGAGSSNSAIKLMAILQGPAANGAYTSLDTCAALRAAGANTFVSINEVTTVVAMNALAQFFNPSTERIGTSATNYLGLTNAFNLDSQIMTPATGVVNTTFTPAGTTSISGAGTSNTARANITGTPEADKIYMIANILAACVNTAGPTGSLTNPAACDTLFADAVPPPTPATTTMGAGFTFPAATDTLQAAYYLATNPINATTAGVPNSAKIAELYGLQSTRQAFTSTGAQPTDWTIGVTYGSTAYLNATGYCLSAPLSLQTDYNGNVYYLNTLSAYPTGATLASLNPYGGLNSCGVGSYQPLQGFTMDAATYTTSNIGYVTRTGTKNIYSTHAGGATNLVTPEDAGDSNLTFPPTSFAADGKSVFFTSTTAGDAGSIFQVPAETQTNTPFTGTTAVVSSTYPVNYGHTISGLVAGSGSATASPMVIDAVSDIWVAAGNSVYRVPYNAYPSAGASGTTPTTPTAISGTFVAPAGLAVDHANNVWITNGVGGSPANGYLSYYQASSGNVIADATAGDGGVNNPAGVAVDGAGNVWVASSGQTSSFTGQTVSEFALISGSLTALSPSVGFAHTYNKPGTITVDISGNVWVANTGTYATSSVPGTLTQIVGAAVPTVAPLAAGILHNTLGTLP